MIEAEGKPGLMLRVAVSGGGCSGFQYGFTFDDTIRDDDLTFARNGVTVVVDDVSLDLLQGAEIDYVEELIGASFQIRNPNASSSCGCGSSFRGLTAGRPADPSMVPFSGWGNFFSELME